jgi:hypothetical protein
MENLQSQTVSGFSCILESTILPALIHFEGQNSDAKAEARHVPVHKQRTRAFRPEDSMQNQQHLWYGKPHL